MTTPGNAGSWAGGWDEPGVLSLVLIQAGTPGTGLFVYNGVPALGNPPIAWMGSSTDPFGNVLPSVSGVASTGQFSAGDVIINTAGLFVYAGTPAKNNMIASVAGTTGTDQFGNDYLSSTTVYQFISPSLNKWAATSMFGSTRLTYLSSGSNQTGYTVGPASEVFVNSGWTLTAPSSATVISDTGQYQRSTSGLTGAMSLDIMDVTSRTNANQAGTQNASAVVTIPANDCLVAGTTYEIETEFTGTWQNQTLAIGHRIDAAAVGAVPQYPVIAAGFFPAAQTFSGYIRTKLRILTTGAGGTCNIFDIGAINQSAANASSAAVGGTALLGRQVGIAFDTTVAHTLSIGTLWGGSTAGQTITSYGSSFKRKGP